MDFGANKAPVEVIKKGAFGGTYFRNIYSSVDRKWYKKSWKQFEQLKNIIIVQIITMLVSVNMVLNAEHR